LEPGVEFGLDLHEISSETGRFPDEVTDVDLEWFDGRGLFKDDGVRPRKQNGG
jgi:hypothetical protein